MSAQETGGPAFPNVPTGAGDKWEDWDMGMTLRDYFAAKVMHAEIVTCGVPGEACDAMIEAMESGDSVEDAIAKTSYRMADAILRARQS